MGEIADSMLAGESCQRCGAWFDDFLEEGCCPGHPRTCDECIAEAHEILEAAGVSVLSADERFALMQAFCVLGAVAQDDAEPREALDPRMSAFDAMQHIEAVVKRLATLPPHDATGMPEVRR